MNIGVVEMAVPIESRRDRLFALNFKLAEPVLEIVATVVSVPWVPRTVEDSKPVISWNVVSLQQIPHGYFLVHQMAQLHLLASDTSMWSHIKRTTWHCGALLFYSV
jgi:hypothetical protein